MTKISNFNYTIIIISEIKRDERLSESPLVLRHQDTSQAPEFVEKFEEQCVSLDYDF